MTNRHSHRQNLSETRIRMKNVRWTNAHNIFIVQYLFVVQTEGQAASIQLRRLHRVTSECV